MGIPFDLIFYQRKKYGDSIHLFDDLSAYESQVCNSFFSTDPRRSHVEESNMIIITENKDTLIRFSSENKSGKLYFNTLDYYQDEICKLDDNNNVYLEEAESPIVLFRNTSKNKESFYPFVPGVYFIYVECDDQKYYAYLCVKPKQLSEDNLVLMRNELEDTVENLAHILIKSASTSFESESFNDDNMLSNKLLLLVQNSSRLLSSVADVTYSPRYSLKTEYNLIHESKVRIIDSHTIKNRLRKSESLDRLLVPKRNVTRNTAENRVLLEAVSYLLKITKKSISYISRISKDLERKHVKKIYKGVNQLGKESNEINNVIEQRRILLKLQSTFVHLLNQPWTEEIEGKDSYARGIAMDGRYRFIHKIYKECKQVKKKLVFDQDFAYEWQRTDRLYEMWCTIRIIKMLQTPEIGFKAVSGWIFDDESLVKTWFVPMLSEGTTIRFEGPDNQIIILRYDDEIAKNFKETTYENPVFAEQPKNKPDVRMDYYKYDRYCGSMIAEFKYRPAKAIGSLVVSEYNRNGYVYNQLVNYSHLVSNYVNKTSQDKKGKMLDRNLAVRNVWVLYPNELNQEPKPMERVHKDGWAVKVPYSPNESLDKLITGFQEFIDMYNEDEE